MWPRGRGEEIRSDSGNNLEVPRRKVKAYRREEIQYRAKAPNAILRSNGRAESSNGRIQLLTCSLEFRGLVSWK